MASAENKAQERSRPQAKTSKLIVDLAIPHWPIEQQIGVFMRLAWHLRNHPLPEIREIPIEQAYLGLNAANMKAATNRPIEKKKGRQFSEATPLNAFVIDHLTSLLFNRKSSGLVKQLVPQAIPRLNEEFTERAYALGAITPNNFEDWLSVLWAQIAATYNNRPGDLSRYRCGFAVHDLRPIFFGAQEEIIKGIGAKLQKTVAGKKKIEDRTAAHIKACVRMVFRRVLKNWATIKSLSIYGDLLESFESK